MRKPLAQIAVRCRLASVAAVPDPRRAVAVPSR